MRLPPLTDHSPSRRRWLGALLPLVLLAAVLTGAAVARVAPRALPGLVLGLVGLAIVGWLLISTLWPARADRRCPSCGKETLERLSPVSTVGVRCTACGFRDATRSAWYFAEEEDEPISSEARRPSNMDRGPTTD